MTRVLVTGGSGFIGSHVVDKLRDAGHEPVIYDLRPSPWHDDVETVIGCLSDVDALTDALRGCGAVAHLAAAADVDEVQRDPLAAEQANARGTASVLEAARRAEVGRVVYASTVWVYSDCEGTHVDEQTPLPAPAHLYTATKLAGEMYCRSYSELYGMDYTILRFGIPYGPRARPAAVVPAMAGRALRGEPITIAGDGMQTRRFVYVEDLADGVVRGLAPGAANRIYNLVSTEDVTIRRVAETVQQVVGDAEIIYGPGRNGDFGGVEIDGSRAERELGWRASTSFEEGVRRYVDSVREPAEVAAPAVAAVAAPHRWLAAARWAAAPLLLVATWIICLLTVDWMDTAMDTAPLEMSLLALLVPIALVRSIHWGAEARRRLGEGFWLVTVGLLLAAIFTIPGKERAVAHLDVLLLLMISCSVAAALATGGPLTAWRERFSESG